jgi:hypothetical protein
MLYLLKDNINTQMWSETQSYFLNLLFLVAIMMLSKNNFQASVYLMFGFIIMNSPMTQKRQKKDRVEGFSPIADKIQDDVAAAYPNAFSETHVGTASDVPAASPNAYMLDPTLVADDQSTPATLGANFSEPSSEPVGEPLGYAGDDMLFETL